MISPELSFLTPTSRPHESVRAVLGHPTDLEKSSYNKRFAQLAWHSTKQRKPKANVLTLVTSIGPGENQKEYQMALLQPLAGSVEGPSICLYRLWEIPPNEADNRSSVKRGELRLIRGVGRYGRQWFAMHTTGGLKISRYIGMYYTVIKRLWTPCLLALPFISTLMKGK